VNSQGRLECKGTSTRDTEIAAGRVTGAIYSAPSEGAGVEILTILAYVKAM